VKLPRIIGWIRDAWLILGLSLLLFLTLEGAYRFQRGVRFGFSEPPDPTESPRHPNAGEAWWRGWFDQPVFKRYHRYDPYRGWWKKPYSSPWFNVDSAGNRVTVQAAAGSSPRLRVLMLGGSTMWGYTSRDSFTIPSLLAAELARRGLAGVEVVNLAQPGYNSTQEFITLSLELRRGAVPAAAVFLDGHNDVAAAFSQGRAGATLNEDVYADIFENRGRSLAASLTALFNYSALISHLRRTVGPARATPLGPTPETMCRDLARLYVGTVRAVEALAGHYGFVPLFLRQPQLLTSSKRRSDWENRLPPPKYAQHLVACAAMTDSVMADRSGRSYLPLDPLFADDTTDVFLDHSAHVTDRANAVIASRIADAIGPDLTSRSRTLN
jgi:hypothetical protein